MKKIFLSVLGAGMLATAANAQLIIGPELGLNMANMSIKNTSTSMKVGLAIGASVDFSLTDNISLQPGLFYLMNGCKVGSTATTPEVTYSVNTINIPINVQYKFGEPGGNRFFVGVGPYLGYNISGNAKVGDKSSSLNIGSDKAKDDIKAMDFGAGLNVGYLLANGVFVRVHYNIGFSNLSPQDGGDAKASAIGLTVGYNLGGKAKKAGTK